MGTNIDGKLQLIQLQAHFQTEQNGDEIFLKMKGKKIWPLKRGFYSCLKQSTQIQLNIEKEVEVKPNQKVSIELWEHDFLFIRKKLGEFNLLVDQTGGPFVTDLQLASKEFARYSLMWEVR
jgi:hypothetical protein